LVMLSAHSSKTLTKTQKVSKKFKSRLSTAFRNGIDPEKTIKPPRTFVFNLIL
jgi:hypothetical protein